MTTNIDAIRAAFADKLTLDRQIQSPEWAQAFKVVPRHEFLPRFFIQTNDGRWQAIDAAHPDYLNLVYADTTLTTQIDGHVLPDPAVEPVKGTGTSSSTQPGLMAVMLEALQIDAGQRVLEIGTGTGYNASLLAYRLGSTNVTTVEVDAEVADTATARIKACGFEPTVIFGDGRAGWPGNAPYDRVIATCSVPTVPRAWIDQTRDGGKIVTSLWRELGGGPLVRLDVHEGRAQGFFLPNSGGFMPVRSHTDLSADDALSVAFKQEGQRRTAAADASVLTDHDAGLWLALFVPGASWLEFIPNEGGPQMWLFAPDGSWSMLDEQAGEVEQFGPRRLWDEIERVHAMWTGLGSPARDRLGLTVEPDGQHVFWLDEPLNHLVSDL